MDQDRKARDKEIKLMAKKAARKEGVPLVYWIIPWTISLAAIAISLFVITAH